MRDLERGEGLPATATAVGPAGLTAGKVGCTRVVCEQNQRVQILSFPEEATPSELRVQVREIQEQAWPSTRVSLTPADAPTHDPVLRPWSMLLMEEGTVLAALDILSKEIAHTGRRYAAGGLSTVVTRREARGRGCSPRVWTWGFSLATAGSRRSMRARAGTFFLGRCSSGEHRRFPSRATSPASTR